MNFLKRLGAKEGKPLAGKETLGLSPEEVVALLKREAEASRSVERGRGACAKIMSIARDLEALLAGLQAKAVPEKTATGSQAVKDRFCRIAREQLASLRLQGSGLEDAERFLEEARGVAMNLGGTTPKQMAHIAFFFEGDMKALSRRLKEISGLCEQAAAALKPARDHRKAAALLASLRGMEAEKKNKKERAGAIQEKIASLEDSLRGIEEAMAQNGAVGAEDARNRLGEAEAAAREAEQDVIALLAVGKVLRRYRHSTGIRDPLLELYLSEPARALAEDSGLRIIGFLAEAVKAEADPRKAERARLIAGNPRMLEEKRARLLERGKEAERLRNELETLLAPARERRRQREAGKAAAGAELQELKKESGRLESDLAALEKEQQAAQQAIRALAPAARS